MRAEEEDVDAEEAVGYLSSYLQRVIRLCLKDIADRDGEKQGDIIKTKIPIFYWYYMSLLSC